MELILLSILQPSFAQKRGMKKRANYLKVLSTPIRKIESLYLSFALIKDDMGQYEEAIKYYRLYLRATGSTSERNESNREN